MVTYERLPQKVAANLFDVPKFQKSRFLKDFLLLNPTLLLHLLLPMQRNYLACLAACRNIEFSRINTSSVFGVGFAELGFGQKLRVGFQKIWIYLPLDPQAFSFVD